MGEETSMRCVRYPIGCGRLIYFQKETERARKSKQITLGRTFTMKRLRIIVAAFVLVFGITASWAASVDRISAATGIPVATLQAERASTGLGWGSLEKAHLLANASGQSF